MNRKPKINKTTKTTISFCFHSICERKRDFYLTKNVHKIFMLEIYKKKNNRRMVESLTKYQFIDLDEFKEDEENQETNIGLCIDGIKQFYLVDNLQANNTHTHI